MSRATSAQVVPETEERSGQPPAQAASPKDPAVENAEAPPSGSGADSEQKLQHSAEAPPANPSTPTESVQKDKRESSDDVPVLPPTTIGGAKLLESYCDALCQLIEQKRVAVPTDDPKFIDCLKEEVKWLHDVARLQNEERNLYNVFVKSTTGDKKTRNDLMRNILIAYATALFNDESSAKKAFLPLLKNSFTKYKHRSEGENFALNGFSFDFNRAMPGLYQHIANAVSDENILCAEGPDKKFLTELQFLERGWLDSYSASLRLCCKRKFHRFDDAEKKLFAFDAFKKNVTEDPTNLGLKLKIFLLAERFLTPVFLCETAAENGKKTILNPGGKNKKTCAILFTDEAGTWTRSLYEDRPRSSIVECINHPRRALYEEVERRAAQRTALAVFSNTALALAGLANGVTSILQLFDRTALDSSNSMIAADCLLGDQANGWISAIVILLSSIFALRANQYLLGSNEALGKKLFQGYLNVQIPRGVKKNQILDWKDEHDTAIYVPKRYTEKTCLSLFKDFFWQCNCVSRSTKEAALIWGSFLTNVVSVLTTLIVMYQSEASKEHCSTIKIMLTVVPIVTAFINFLGNRRLLDRNKLLVDYAKEEQIETRGLEAEAIHDARGLGGVFQKTPS